MNKKAGEPSVLRISFSEGIPSRALSFSGIFEVGLGYFMATKGIQEPLSAQQVGEIIAKHETTVGRFSKPLTFFRLIEKAGTGYQLTTKAMKFFAEYQHTEDPIAQAKASTIFREVLNSNSEFSETIIPALEFGFKQNQLKTRNSVENRILSIFHQSTENENARKFAAVIVDALDFAGIVKLSADSKKASFSSVSAKIPIEERKTSDLATRDTEIPAKSDISIKPELSALSLSSPSVQICININLPGDNNAPELTGQVLSEVRRFLNSISKRS
ncbi:MAG: hypothetical protein ACE5OZ_04100 [Candidatus Heimdallarchaeota archaeon]